MSSSRSNVSDNVSSAESTRDVGRTHSLPAAPSPYSTGGSRCDNEEPPFRLIWEAEWNDVPCSDYLLTPERWAKESFAPLANTHVDALAYNVCSSDGYIAQLENGELLLDDVEQLEDAWYWRYRENSKRLIKAGANPPDMAVKYGRK